MPGCVEPSGTHCVYHASLCVPCRNHFQGAANSWNDLIVRRGIKVRILGNFHSCDPVKSWTPETDRVSLNFVALPLAAVERTWNKNSSQGQRHSSCSLPARQRSVSDRLASRQPADTVFTFRGGLLSRTSSEGALTYLARRNAVSPKHDTSHLTPYTPHPTPYTLHPTSYTLHPTPCTLHPTP